MTSRIPNSIAQKRKERGLSQDALSKKLGITITQLSRLENGKSSMTQARMQQIADVLEVKPQELYLAPHQTGELNLDIMHSIIEQLDTLLQRLELSVPSKKRADLCIAIYKMETKRLEKDGLSSGDVNVSEYEDILETMAK
jgi:transcriptional regulator with XRE-family HTH domain